ncbi:MAG: hypothetical protein ACRYFY_19580 [Janthinobacterium lividum]
MKTAAERVTAMRQRRYEQGLQMLVLWVPKDRAVEIRELVQQTLASPVQETFDRPPAAVSETLEASRTEPAAGTVVTSQGRPSKWKIILPPTRTSSGLKAMLRQVGMTCSAAGRWHGVLTPAQQQALEPMVEEAQGQWEKA